MTFFWMDKGIDTGDIWCQEKFAVPPTLKELNDRVKESIIRLLNENVPLLDKGYFCRIPQGKGTYWRKRVKGRDKWIDV